MQKNRKTLLWVARVTGLLAALFFLILFMNRGPNDFLGEPGGVPKQFYILLAFALAGYILAWFRERDGGLILMLSGIIMALYVFYLLQEHKLAGTLACSLSFFIPGLLFYVYGRLAKQD
jgi:hypothetical protein